VSGRGLTYGVDGNTIMPMTNAQRGARTAWLLVAVLAAVNLAAMATTGTRGDALPLLASVGLLGLALLVLQDLGARRR
jgi:hypothetical protein